MSSLYRYLRGGLLFCLLIFNACATGAYRYPDIMEQKNAEGVIHRVQKGQTLWRITRTYGVDLQEVAEINNIMNISQISIGQDIFIPHSAKVLYVEPSLSLKGSESGEKSPRIKTYKGKFKWPAKGVLYSKFGLRDGIRHDGIDISAPVGTPIYAARSGTVIYSSNKLRGYGNLIIIRHNKGMSTVYAHNQKNLVKEGKKIKAGQLIARVGMTGRTTGPHLHFEVRDGKRARNPLFYLP